MSARLQFQKCQTVCMADYRLDARFDYGERRVTATGMFLGRLTVVVFTPEGRKVRIISWRKANQREIKRYGYKI